MVKYKFPDERWVWAILDAVAEVNAAFALGESDVEEAIGCLDGIACSWYDRDKMLVVGGLRARSGCGLPELRQAEILLCDDLLAEVAGDNFPIFVMRIHFCVVWCAC